MYRNDTEIEIASTPDRTSYLVFSILIARSFTGPNLTTRDSKLPVSFGCFPTFNEPEMTVWLLCLRFRQRSIERAMDLTDSFTWEDLPTRDADTGHLTAAGWIPLIMMYSKSAAIATLCFHTVQSTIRIVTNHETIVPVWYPFDWTVSPFYELVNISQVTLYKTQFSSICFILFLI
jgi:hypothetical protein